MLAKHQGTPGEPGETASEEASRKKTSGEDRGRPGKQLWRVPQVLSKHLETPGEPGETASEEASHKKTSCEDRGRPGKQL